MVDSKSRYEFSRALMNTLPPIKEESFLSTSSGGTPRNVKKVTINNRPVLVQTLPPDPRPVPPPTPKPLPEPEPILEEADDVNQVVADYLHYARYSASVPVQPEPWNHAETYYCSCCSERNMQSFRRQHGMPEKPAKPRKDGAHEPQTSRSSKSHDSPRQSWMAYQPLPYAKTYLNPEFNRPSMIYQYENEMKGSKENGKVRAEILESSTKFDQAMKKLKFTSQKLDPNFDENMMSFS